MRPKKVLCTTKATRDELNELDDKILWHMLIVEDQEVCDKEVDDSRDYIKKIDRSTCFYRGRVIRKV